MSAKFLRKTFLTVFSILCVSFIFIISLPVLALNPEEEVHYDIIIKGGQLLDGSLKKPFKADIAIKDGRIVKIGNLKNAKADKTINAKDLYVTPGFIDLHSHVDEGMYFPELRSCYNYLTQGVTTAVVGQCGRSAWPIFEKVTDQINRWTKEGIGINTALLAGHGQVREMVMGVENREPTKNELKKMKQLVKEAMEGGAHGLSTGLAYAPGSYSKTDELIELVKEIVPYDGIYHTHMRNEGDHLIESIEETIKIAEETGAPANISHLKAVSRANWGKVVQASQLIEEARKNGLNITADQYPYPVISIYPYYNLLPGKTWYGEDENQPDIESEIRNAFNSLRDHQLIGLYSTVLPSPLLSEHFAEYLDNLSRDELVRIVSQEFAADISARGAEDIRARVAFLKRMNKPEEAEKIRQEIEKYIEDWVGAENIMIAISVEPQIVGKTLKEVAEMKGKSIADTAIELELQGAKAIPYQLSPEDVAYVMKKDYVSTGSDGIAPFFGIGLVHPRIYGTFPHKIRYYCLEKQIVSLPHVVRSSTSLPASVMGWKDRGMLKEGYWADITIFNPKTIRQVASFTAPHCYSSGIEYVLVNGKLAIEEGKYTGKLAGKILQTQQD
jgi:N-acyl-D-amino-acid deacylase